MISRTALVVSVRRGLAASGLTCCLAWASVAAGQSLDDARALYDAGRYAEALAAFEEVARIDAAEPASAVVAHHNACYLRIFELTDYPAALDHCQKALELRRQLGDERGLARTLNIQALVFQGLGRYGEAERCFDEALEINERRGDAEAVVINLSNLGSLATVSGRYTEAMRHHTEALKIARRHAEEPWAVERLLVDRINYGAVLEKVGAYREALSVYEDILANEASLDGPASAGSRAAAIRRATLQVNRGVMYRNLGDPVQAVAAFEQAVETFGAVDDTTGLSNAWLNLGLAWHLNLARPRVAEDAYRRALAYARASGDRFEEIQDFFYLGRLLLDENRLDEAEAAFESCLEVAAAEESAKGSAEGRWSGFEGLGRIAERRGDLEAAFEHLSRAIDEIEQVRAGLGRSRRAGYFGDKRAVYAAAVRVLAELGERQPEGDHVERAFELVQKAKARELIEALGREPQAAFESAETLRERIGGDQLLELFVGEEQIFAWVVDRNGVRMADLGSAEAVVSRVVAVHRALAAGEEPAAGDLATLATTLVAETGIAGGTSHLWIAPDGRLDYLPFELLEIDGEALIDRRPVSYLPSAAALAWLRRETAPPELGLVGFGDPALSRRPAGRRIAGGSDGEVPVSGARTAGEAPAGSAVASFTTPAEMLVERFRLAPLPAAARELEAIAARLPGPHEIRLRAEATEVALRRLAARGSRALHLATHSVADERPGRGAAILLTPENGDDGILGPEEIAALDLKTRLTVLASCSSALGPEESGRALASLTGAFLAAGSPAVIATLWDVDDGATAIFMEQLYFELAAGRLPAEALRRVKQRLRSDPRWSRPDLWAGYVLIGDAPALVARRAPWRWLAAGGLALVALMLAAWRWRRR